MQITVKFIIWLTLYSIGDPVDTYTLIIFGLALCMRESIMKLRSIYMYCNYAGVTHVCIVIMGSGEVTDLCIDIMRSGEATHDCMYCPHEITVKELLCILTSWAQGMVFCLSI